MQKTQSFTRTKWIYSLSGVGRDMAYTLFATYLLTYAMYTRALTAAQFAAIGGILTACRVWDAVNDPVMGGIIENTRSRFGKFKPWIFIGALTNAAVLVVMFTMRATGWTFVALFGVLYLLWDVTFTMNDIGYWSMLPSLTSDARRRDSLTSLANLFAGVGAIIATGLIPVFTNGSLAIGGSSVSGYAAVGIFIALFFLLCQTWLCAGVKPPVRTMQPGGHTGLKKLLATILKNDQLLWVTLVMLLYCLASTLINVLGVSYMYLTFGYNGFNVTLFVAFYAVANVAVNALYPALARRFTRARLAAAAILIAVAGYAAFFLTGIALPMNIFVLCGSGFIIGFGQSVFYMVATICLANTIEYNELKTGSRDEAVIFSLRPFMTKLASALQQVIVTVVYMAIGLTAITNEISEIENSVSLGTLEETEKLPAVEAVLAQAPGSTAMLLKACIVVIPVVLLLAAYAVLRRKCRIDEKEYARILAELEARSASGQE